jgi:signal transduction histidine kinase
LKSWTINWWLALNLATAVQAQETALPVTNPVVVTSVSELRRMTNSQPVQVRLTGTVSVINRATGSLLFRDDAGPKAVVEMSPISRELRPGQKVLLTGTGVMYGSTLSLIDKPLVDNDGMHGMVEKSAEIYLKAGRQPIRLEWFNETGAYGLEVYYQGPDLPRQKIPDSALFHALLKEENSSTSEISPGLNYRYYEGANWTRLPAFGQLNATRIGTTTNFDLSVITRTNYVGLEFTGYVEIPKDGLYTFSTVSDDGSKLFLGEAPFRSEVLGLSDQPIVWTPIVIGQTLSGEDENQLVEVEGTVTFVSEQTGGTQLELTSGAGRMRVQVAAELKDAPACLVKAQVSIRGICQGVFAGEGRKTAGALQVSGWEQVTLLQIAAEHWTATPAVPIAGLLTNQLLRTNRAVVRVQGTLRKSEKPGKLVMEDATGRLPVEGIQFPTTAINADLGVLGRIKWNDNLAVLAVVSYRELVQSGNSNSTALPLLTSAAQVQFLPREEAARKYPARVRGVVTSTFSWSDTAFHNGLVVQDATRGVFVWPPTNNNGGKEIPLGEYVEIEGVTDPGDFAPVIMATHVIDLGLGEMPDPVRPNPDQLMNGSLDALYVEIPGVITAVDQSGETDDRFVTLLTLTGKYRVFLSHLPAPDLGIFKNARVRIKGCLYASWDNQTRQIKIGELRIFNASISVDEPAPADVFSAPEKSAEELLHFDAQASALKRVKVSGQVIHERSGEFFLMNGTNGLRFFPREQVQLQPGDLVDVVGFPDLGGASPALREAIVRRTGHAPLPHPHPLAADKMLQSEFDSTLVQINSQLTGSRSNAAGQILELQTGTRTYLARLNSNAGAVFRAPVGSHLQLTGVYAGQGGDRAEKRDIDSFELLLNSASDITVLERPSWWTPGHTLTLVGALATGLLLAGGWISSLRLQVNQRTGQLRVEIDQHKRTEAELAAEIQERRRTQNELEEKKGSLEKEIEERKRIEREVESIHRQLMDASRQAGQAEVATSVLHNVGNVLNSVNVSVSVLSDRLRRAPFANLAKGVVLIREHQADLTRFLNEDPRGRKLLPWLDQLAGRLKEEQDDLQLEVGHLAEHVEHIKEIVVMQQGYAKISGITEKMTLPEAVESALKMHAGAFERHAVALERQFEDTPPVILDKHKLLQILVNLLHNAKNACDETSRPDKRVVVRILKKDANFLAIEIEDTGVGIAPENLTRIFAHGFTTRKQGHGFGLHSSALAARELGGQLTAYSEGLGKGARFTLDLPVTLSETS